MPPQPTVLLVDDEAPVRRALRRLFERAGFEVREASSGPEALALVAQADVQIDALVCDVIMPELSGLEFYDRLIAAAPEMTRRVVFLTGAASEPVVHEPIEERAVPLINKLDDLQIVVDQVKIMLYAAGGGRRSVKPAE